MSLLHRSLAQGLPALRRDLSEAVKPHHAGCVKARARLERLTQWELQRGELPALPPERRREAA